MTGLFVLPDGKAVAVGQGTLGWAGPHHSAWRIGADGATDTTFGASGFTEASFGGDESPGRVAMRGNGEYCSGGWSNHTEDWFNVACFPSNGSPAGGWGGDSWPITSGRNGRGYDIVIHAGDFAVLAGYTETAASGRDFALTRVSLANMGTGPDPAFGSNGRVNTDFGAAVDEEARALVIPQPGKLLAAGFSLASGSADFALAQYAATTPVQLLGLEVN